MKNQTRKEPKNHLSLDLILEKIILGIAPVGDVASVQARQPFAPLTGNREAPGTSRGPVREKGRAGRNDAPASHRKQVTR